MSNLDLREGSSVKKIANSTVIVLLARLAMFGAPLVCVAAYNILDGRFQDINTRLAVIGAKIDAQGGRDAVQDSRLDKAEEAMRLGKEARLQFQNDVARRLDKIEEGQLDIVRGLSALTATLKEMDRGHP